MSIDSSSERRTEPSSAQPKPSRAFGCLTGREPPPGAANLGGCYPGTGHFFWRDAGLFFQLFPPVLGRLRDDFGTILRPGTWSEPGPSPGQKMASRGVSMGAKTFVSEMAFFCAHDFWGFFVSGQIRKRAIRTDFRCASDPHSRVSFEFVLLIFCRVRGGGQGGYIYRETGMN